MKKLLKKAFPALMCLFMLFLLAGLFTACTLNDKPDVSGNFAAVPDAQLDTASQEDGSRAITNVPLIHKYSGKYVCSNSLVNYAEVFLYSPIPTGFTSYFQYDFIGASDDINYTYIRHKASGKYLCCNSTSNGAYLFFYGPIPAGAEDMFKFKIMYSGTGNYYYFQHKYSGKYMCTGATENFGRLHLWGPIPAGHEDRYRFRYY